MKNLLKKILKFLMNSFKNLKALLMLREILENKLLNY